MLSRKSILFLIFLSLSVSTYFIADYIKKEKLSFYKQLIYDHAKADMSKSFHSVYSSFQTDTFNEAKKIIDSLNIYDYLTKPYKEFNYFSSKDTYLKIYDQKGTLLYSNNKFADSKDIDIRIKHIIKKPAYNYSYLTSLQGLTLSHIFPVYDKELKGFVQLDFQLDKINIELNKDHIKSIIILNKQLSKLVDLNLSYSRNFINDHYIVNKNADNYYQKILEQNKIIDTAKKSLINENEGVAIVKEQIISPNSSIADIYLIKPIETLDTSTLNFITKQFAIITFLLIFIYSVFIYFIYISYRNNEYILQNKELLTENKKLRDISDQLDYNEKKLSNLFNLQPNIMFISNGVDIVQVNKRFMGFFRRYKSFENFKRHHKDISELFEPCDKANYIDEELIEGQYWLEYILENPKRLYKTVMSVDNEPHHFIIKVNEMDYVRNFQERFIVVAFVDVTQDVTEKNAIIEHKDIENVYDITYILENVLTLGINDFINIVPTRQTIFKANAAEIDPLTFLVSIINIKTSNGTANSQNHSWQILLPSKTISFIINQITSNYDQNLDNTIDKDSIKTIVNLVNNILNRFIENINHIKHKELYPAQYSIIKNEIIEHTSVINTDNLYKFIMFVEDQELDIYINFDESSMKFFRQVQMLGAFFDNQ